MVVACGHVRVVTPPMKGLAVKQEGIFPNQRLYMPDQHAPTMDDVEGMMSYPHQPPTWEGLATK
jgi:hypothetical protein